ncbi:MAG: acyltransferase [Pirellulaceae bacterium]|nr:acyltransferase [Pirellulaceae bacterium]
MHAESLTVPVKRTRIVELDALRALAAINLMVFHFTHLYSAKFGYSTPLGFDFPYGKYGVLLFFMLSGAVNALTLAKKQDAGKFLSARCLRILPCYYIVLALNLVLMTCQPLATGPGWTWPQLLANLTVMPNLFGYECLEPVMWTLQIEILFYGLLIFFYLCGWLDKPLRSIPAALIVCLVGCLGIDYLETHLGSESALVVSATLVRRILLLDYFPQFAIGILLQQCWQADTQRSASGSSSLPGWAWRHRKTLWCVMASLIVLHLTDHRSFNPVVSVGFTALLAASLYGNVPFLRFKPLVFISGISYMVYLLHYHTGCVFIHWINEGMGVPPVVSFALALPFTIAVSTLAAYGLERPLAKFLRERLFRQPSSSAMPNPLNAVAQGVR